MAIDPRTALLFAVSATGSALSGVIPAVTVLIMSLALAVLLGVGWRRLVPLAGSVGTFALLIPLAPAPAIAAVAKGLAVSVSLVAAMAATRWDRLLAALQAAGLGRTAVAFFAIVFRHIESSGRDAARAVDGLVLRGGFRGIRGLRTSTPLVLARTLRRALERADRTAEALELRGFAGRLPRLPHLAVGAGDIILGAAAALSIVIAVASRLPWSR